MTDQTDLLYYVDRLRGPYTDRVVQTNENGVECVTDVTHDGLLKQLRNAVFYDIGRRGTSGAGSDRLPFNAGALALYERIEKEIGEAFVQLVDQPVYLELERTLGLWYLKHTLMVRDGHLTEADDDRAFAVARGWATVIEDMFNPPRLLELTVEHTHMETRTHTVTAFTSAEARQEEIQVEVTSRVPAACPVCENRYGYDPGTGDRILALLLEYQELGAETFGHLRAVCRACGYEWHGEAAARSLMVEIDDTDRRLQREDPPR